MFFDDNDDNIAPELPKKRARTVFWNRDDLLNQSFEERLKRLKNPEIESAKPQQKVKFKKPEPEISTLETNFDFEELRQKFEELKKSDCTL